MYGSWRVPPSAQLLMHGHGACAVSHDGRWRKLKWADVQLAGVTCAVAAPIRCRPYVEAAPSTLLAARDKETPGAMTQIRELK